MTESITKPILEERFLKEILDKEYQIPSYQRPYKWKKEHVVQLLDDLYENIYLKRESIYRVGSIIVHYSNNVNNIVDGQQRLTTLSLVLLHLKSNEKLLNNQIYQHAVSKNNIKYNFQAIVDWFIAKSFDKEDHSRFLQKIKESCQFVVITVYEQDEAFQLFDSQNSRGKALYPHDLLKAFHLREMEKNGSNQTTMELYSTKWEDYLLQGDNLLLDILNNHLYRIRKWVKGEKKYYFDTANLNEFKGISLYKKNRFNYEVAVRLLDGTIENAQLNQVLKHFSIAQKFPFQINMPIINGKNFFDYIFHYIELKQLVFTHNQDKKFLNFNQSWKQYYGWWRTGDEKVRNLYENICLLFVDRFGIDSFENIYYQEFFKNAYQLRLDSKSISVNSILLFVKAQKFFHLIPNCYVTEELHSQLFCNYSKAWRDDAFAKGVKPIYDFIINYKVITENE